MDCGPSAQGHRIGTLFHRGGHRFRLLFAFFACWAGCWACSERRPQSIVVEASTLPKIEVRPSGSYLLTYRDPATHSFATVRAVKDVPAAARAWVRVVDLKLSPTKRMDHELVYVADLQQARADGTFSYVVVSRRAFELAAANRGRAESATSNGLGAKGGVTIYMTSWCGACRKAKAWMRSAGISFVEKDIEKDPSAAAELMKKARAAGISPSGVPVIEVRGQLLQGFSPEAIRTLLKGRPAGASKS